MTEEFVLSGLNRLVGSGHKTTCDFVIKAGSEFGILFERLADIFGDPGVVVLGGWIGESFARGRETQRTGDAADISINEIRRISNLNVTRSGMGDLREIVAAAYVKRSVSSPIEETKAHTLPLTPHQPNKFKKRDVPVFAQMAASPVKECDSFPSPLREFAVGLKKWADYENSRYFKHPFWRDEIFLGRFYQNIRPDSEYLTLFGNKIHHSDMSEVNRILVPQGYVYLSGKHRGGKKTFFLAGIHKRIHKGDFEIFITNEELISSLSLTDLAVLIFSEKIIIGRKRIAESMFWACVAAVKRGGFEQIRPLAKYGLELLTGCEEKRLIAGRPEEIMENIKQTAELWLTHSYINHEWGHIEARRLSISGRLFECLGLAIDLKDQESECVFTALDEVMADTIKKGKYSALIAQEEPSRFGLLCIDLINIIVPTTNPIFDLQQKFAKELLPAFIKYAKTGEIVYFEEAVKR
ncbi:MAG: hypothetical protein KAR31_00960, partial [Candidatus Omnitrophica bacterium]|nr:hypothetical protein [Candidatus Omnitrophota bacterium]